jgi:hypothetical protein
MEACLTDMEAKQEKVEDNMKAIVWHYKWVPRRESMQEWALMFYMETTNERCIRRMLEQLRLIWGPATGCRVPQSTENMDHGLWWILTGIFHCH